MAKDDKKIEKLGEIIKLRQEGKSWREIEKLTGVDDRTAQRWYEKATGIQAKEQSWKEVSLNPWIRLIYDAAREQIYELRNISLDDFIFYCCDFVKDALGLRPPGWVTEVRGAIVLQESEEWNRPEVHRAVKILQGVPDAGKPSDQGVPEDTVIEYSTDEQSGELGEKQGEGVLGSG